MDWYCCECSQHSSAPHIPGADDCYTSSKNRNSFKPTLRETMENTAPGMHAPMAVNVTVDRAVRPREYLTEREIEKLIKAAGENRWDHRDATAILIAYRHGLRSSELVALRWDDIDFQTGKLHVRRVKGGTASVHPIGGRELRALRRLKRETPASTYVFVSERLALLSVAGYQRMVARTGEAAGFPLPRSQSHAAAFLRLQARKRRPGHPGNPALPWTQVD